MSNLRRYIKKLDRKTVRKNTIKSGVPHSRQGQDGDITLRKTINGHKLYAKIDGMWYGILLEGIKGAVRDTLHKKIVKEAQFGGGQRSGQGGTQRRGIST